MFKGQTALITGGSRGIGYALAKRLAKEGATITLLAKNEALLQKSVKQLSTAENQQHSYKVQDLLKLASGQSAPNFASYNILVNCAGITNRTLLVRTPKQEIYDTINLNLTAPIILSQLCAKSMLKDKDQPHSILNISSMLSVTDIFVPGTSVYAASKAGLLGFTASLASELRGKIRVNSIMPGLVKETDMGSIAAKSLKPITMDSVITKSIDILYDKTINGQCIEINDIE
ncbi:unnamed protein product [Candida verbasci]|uniref:3-oxoacyl-[acyl-carrier-protein] reductase n=1 Tax=Candida verbasci TaxID=1227364 RepID=A0A9W4XB59_9ASCO|nr:unnamed protein product [Candida verbasci]